MTEYVRYAIYWLPDGPLGRWGESWLGWDMAEGAPLPRPDVAGLPRPLADVTAAASGYGLHATIKPPFRLAPGTDLDALVQAFGDFCDLTAPVAAGGLRLTDLDGFLALAPAGDTAALDDLAGRLVAAVDRFRAPAPPDELARRKAAGLTARQEALLNLWGYPYVMEEFRFHVTLTGRLSTDEAAQVRAAIAPLLAPLLPERLQIAGLALVGQMAHGGFRLIAHQEFTG